MELIDIDKRVLKAKNRAKFDYKEEKKLINFAKERIRIQINKSMRPPSPKVVATPPAESFMKRRQMFFNTGKEQFEMKVFDKMLSEIKTLNRYAPQTKVTFVDRVVSNPQYWTLILFQFNSIQFSFAQTEAKFNLAIH